MRRTLPMIGAVSGRRINLHRREVVKGVLVMGAALGGVTGGSDNFLAKPEPEPEPEPEPTVFRRGDSGEAVGHLQQQLSSGGYWCGSQDSFYGHLTEQAVFACQKSNGLYRDGVAGPMLDQALTSEYRHPPSSGGDYIEINKARQLILVVRGGATSMAFNTSTANGEPYEFEGRDYTARTPTGDFSVWYTYSSGWQDGELGEMYRPMYYYGNYAIHGSAFIPPYPASHGCARLSSAAMDMFWNDGIMAQGTRVLVV